MPGTKRKNDSSGMSYAKRRATVRASSAVARANRVVRAAIRTASRPNTARLIQGLGEPKGIDTALTLAPVINTFTTNASSFVVNLVQQGTGFFNRNGRKISLKSLRLRLSVEHNYALAATTANLAGNQLRCVVVFDKQPSGVLPTFDAIFANVDQTGTATTTLNSAIRLTNAERFSVLRDMQWEPKIKATPGLGGTVNSVRNLDQLDCFINLKGKETVFASTANPATIADISSGALYVYFRTQANEVHNLVNIADDSFARLRYTDL